MNKYEKALDYLKNNRTISHNHSYYCNILKELVEKEKPLRPYDCEDGIYRCQKCENDLTDHITFETYKLPYCPHCGQKLDWE